MKSQTYKLGKTIIMRITVTGEEIDRNMIHYISGLGPGLARAAHASNTRPLYETTDKTYEFRIPADDDLPQTGWPPDPLSGVPA
jgi:hypothetical protein